MSDFQTQKTDFVILLNTFLRFLSDSFLNSSQSYLCSFMNSYLMVIKEWGAKGSILY